MSINEELNNKISGNSTQGLQGPSLSNVVFPIALKKRQHSARGVREVLDTSFNEISPVSLSISAKTNLLLFKIIDRPVEI